MTESKTIPFRAGDTVRHRPSGEEWLVACVCPPPSFSTGGDFYACGWPATCARSEDCDVLERCSDEEHEDLLRRVSNGRNDDSSRHYWASENLRAIENARRDPFYRPAEVEGWEYDSSLEPTDGITRAWSRTSERHHPNLGLVCAGPGLVRLCRIGGDYTPEELDSLIAMLQHAKQHATPGGAS